MAVIAIAAPCPGRSRQVMAKGEVDPAVADTADRALVAGQRIADAGLLETKCGVKLGALPAERVELESACAFGAEARGMRQVANALVILADRDAVDDVLDLVIPGAQPGLAPDP